MERTIVVERKEVEMADSNTKQIEPDGVRLGEAIRKSREALGLSLRQLAPLAALVQSQQVSQYRIVSSPS